MINTVLTQYCWCWENIADIAHKDAPCFWLRSWRIGQAGSGACVCVCGGLHRSRLGYAPPFQVHRTFVGGKGAPVPVRWIVGGLGGACPCEVLVGRSVNYNDIEYHFGRLTLKVVALISYSIAFCPHPCSFVGVWVCYFNI